MLHDASHGVRVNYRMRCRDKICAPEAREKKTILREPRERDEVDFLTLKAQQRLRSLAIP